MGIPSTPQLWSESDLARAFDLGRKAWPNIALPAEEFTAHLVERVVSPAECDDACVPDLFLACACARLLPAALQAFRERYLGTVAQATRPFDDSPPFAEEIYQRLADSLFVGNGPGQGKIGRYSGRGPLAGFVATAAKRIALRTSAQSKRFQGESELVEQFAQFTEQETALMKLRYRETFNHALSLALRQLPQRERLVLRMNLVERVSTTRIAALYKVSQPTVSRWIQRSARTIFATVKDLVCDELDIDTRKLESLLLLVRSQIEITLSLAGGARSIMRGPYTSDLGAGKSLVLHVEGGTPYRLLLVENGRPFHERSVRDAGDLAAHETVVEVSAEAAASHDDARAALARLAAAIAE